MNNNIHFDQRYETLLKVYTLGSYSTAGDVLALTPSAVAQQVHSLEKELNKKLFTRGTDRLMPTKDCEIILDYFNQVRMLSSRLRDDLGVSDSVTGHITVGLTPGIEEAMLQRIFSGYSNETESVQITVRSAPADSLCEQLRARSLDLVILDGEYPRREFNSILLDTDHLVIAVPHGSIYAAKGVITADELKKEKLIMRPEGSNTRKLFEAHLKKEGHSLSEFSVMMEINNVSTIKRLVAGGYGLSVLSANACKSDEEKGLISTVRLSNMDMSRSINIIYRPECNYDALLHRLQQLYNQKEFTEQTNGI